MVQILKARLCAIAGRVLQTPMAAMGFVAHAKAIFPSFFAKARRRQGPQASRAARRKGRMAALGHKDAPGHEGARASIEKQEATRPTFPDGIVTERPAVQDGDRGHETLASHSQTIWPRHVWPDADVIRNI